MTWNILVGGEQRFDAILSLLGHVRPDVLVLQECLGWEDRVRLGRVAALLEIPNDAAHATLGLARPRGSGKRYHVALLSRAPIDSVRTHNDPHFLGHGLLEAVIGGVTLFGAHFDSHNENLRFVEARFLRSRIDPARFASGKYLLAGDLNALSRRDPYPADLAARLATAGTDKYGHPPRFDVTEELEAAGWIDLLYHRGTPPRWISARRNRGGVHIDYRTDYLYASPAMAQALTSIDIVDADDASDHAAVVAEFTP
ncbi:MAG TPA: endonuclease/exonuclease/phosphatase family protein [Planctomycetota bacterium]|nr:endonuclease/exonuclease/phosphatase family protein [Planctomycetota bacterium]